MEEYMCVCVSDSPSSRADVEIGDEVLAVNGNSLQFFTHQQIITAIHKVHVRSS